MDPMQRSWAVSGCASLHSTLLAALEEASSFFGMIVCSKPPML